MNKKIKKINQIGIIIGVICIVSTSVFAVNLSNIDKEKSNVEIINKQDSKKESIANEVQFVELKAEDILKQISDNEETYDEWENRTESSPAKLPRDKQIELYNQGYDFYDIRVAEELAALCNKTPQELLELKGKTTYEVNEGNIVNSSKPWNDIITELNIILQKPSEALGVTEEELNSIKAEGLSDSDAEQLLILAFNNQKNYKEILNEIKLGKSVKELKKQYWERSKGESNKSISASVAKKNTEETLKRQYNISDEDIEKCKKYEVTEIIDIAMVKDIANKNELELEKVLKIKKDKKDWQSIIKEAEVMNNEK